jgi:hypothetical protein
VREEKTTQLRIDGGRRGTEMTENEWQSCADPTPMLEFLQGRTSDRKLHLFACACCRRLLALVPNPVIRQVVEFGERDADDLAGPLESSEAERAAVSWLEARRTLKATTDTAYGEAYAVRTAKHLTESMPRAALARVSSWNAAAAVREAANDRRAIRAAAARDEVQVARATWRAAEAAFQAERQMQAALLRDIVGDPFRRMVPEPAWQRPEVAVFAQIIYECSAFGRLTELGESLVAAGCKNAAILAHCRQAGPHVRGCWVVDLLTGRA